MTDAATIRWLIDRPKPAKAEDFGATTPVWENYLLRLDGLHFYVNVSRSGVHAVFWAASDSWAVRCYGGREFNVRFPDGFDPGDMVPAPDLSAFGLPANLSWQSATEAQMAQEGTGQARFSADYSFPDGEFTHLTLRLPSHNVLLHYGETDILPQDEPVAITLPLLGGSSPSA